MASSYNKQDFLRSERAELLREELRAMVKDPQYNTRLRYSVQTPDGSNFVAKHMDYMSCHPVIDPANYIANLKLMTRLKKQNV